MSRKPPPVTPRKIRYVVEPYLPGMLDSGDERFVARVIGSRHYVGPFRSLAAADAWVAFRGAQRQEDARG